MRAGIAGVMVLLAGAAPGPCRAQPDPPVVTSPEWFTWYQNLLAQRLGEVPLERGTTYYFSQAGDDVSGDGSMANPWKSLSKAQAVLTAAAPAGDVAVLFRRGDVWREPFGLNVGTKNITIADYGEGAKPLFTAFVSVGDPSLWSPTPGFANVYQRSAPVQVTCAKQDEDLDRPWSWQSTVAGVGATEGSWCWKKGVLYVHPRHGLGGVATDPRVDGNAYEVVAVPDAQASPGVLVRGDGSRVQNLRAQGWGTTVTLGMHIHPFESRVWGNDRAVFVGCEGYYSRSHVITHLSAEGGIATFVDCKAGLTTASPGMGETVFNTYTYFGECRTIFDHCEATHGTQPSDQTPPGHRRGAAFYGHTSANPGSYLGLTIVKDCVTRDTAWGCATGAGFSDTRPAAALKDVRCFIVGELFEGGAGTGQDWTLGQWFGVRVNGKTSIRPSSSNLPWLSGAQRGWVFNSSIEVDCTEVTGDLSLYRGVQATKVQMWNCALTVRTRPGQTFRFDGDTPPKSAGSVVANSVIVCTGGGTFDPNLGVASPVKRRRGQPALPLKSNAYFGVDAAVVSKDPYAVLLTEVPGKISCISPLACEATEMPSGYTMEYDQRGWECARNDLGPVEVPWCANCDGSTSPPVLN